METINILFLGDIIGKSGRKIVKEFLPEYKKSNEIDLVIANGENLAGGFGITEKTANEMFRIGIDVFTSGNHIWDKKEGLQFIKSEERIIRPANYPPGVPGRGYNVFKRKNTKIAILNLEGRVFMGSKDCPFRKADEIINILKNEDVKIIIVDFHAETTSEKIALSWYLDGKVSAIFGTHTHIQTADEKILPNGTAYITDAGMCGPDNSVIGMKKEIAIKRFLTGMPERFQVAKDNLMINGVFVEINPLDGKSISIKRLKIYENELS